MTECPHCKKKFGDWRDYANHILEQHPSDEIRAEWAKEALSPTAPETPKKGPLLRSLFAPKPKASDVRMKKLEEQMDKLIKERETHNLQ